MDEWMRVLQWLPVGLCVGVREEDEACVAPAGVPEALEWSSDLSSSAPHQGDWVWLKKFPGDQHSEVKPATKLAFCKVRGPQRTTLGHVGQCWVMGDDVGSWGTMLGQGGQCWVMGDTVGSWGTTLGHGGQR